MQQSPSLWYVYISLPPFPHPFSSSSTNTFNKASSTLPFWKHHHEIHFWCTYPSFTRYHPLLYICVRANARTYSYNFFFFFFKIIKKYFQPYPFSSCFSRLILLLLYILTKAHSILSHSSIIDIIPIYINTGSMLARLSTFTIISQTPKYFSSTHV